MGDKDEFVTKEQTLCYDRRTMTFRSLGVPLPLPEGTLWLCHRPPRWRGGLVPESVTCLRGQSRTRHPFVLTGSVEPMWNINDVPRLVGLLNTSTLPSYFIFLAIFILYWLYGVYLQENLRTFKKGLWRTSTSFKYSVGPKFRRGRRRPPRTPLNKWRGLE